MLKLALMLSLITGCYVVHSTTLAGAGYIASNPYVRNILIQTGIADGVRLHAETLYDMSGFRYGGDERTRRRKALMFNHEIIEVPHIDAAGSKEISLKRSKREYPLRKERERLEKLFSVLHSMDGNSCISRLLCEIGADPKPYGMIGFKIGNYVRSLPPVTWNSETYPYVEAFDIGSQIGKRECQKYFEGCIYNLHRIISFLWMFIFTSSH